MTGDARLRVSFLLMLLLLSACGSARRSVPVAGPMEMTETQVVEGERAFMRACNRCHPRGESGLAPAINNKPLPGFLMRFQIRHGIGAMPSFSEGELSDEEVDAIVAYLKYMRGRG